jgi:hypothetical protein
MHNKVNFDASSVFRFETQCRKDDYPFFMYEPRKGTPSPSACVHIAPDESCAFMNEAQHSHFNAPCVFMFETQCGTQIVPSVNDVCTKVCLPLQWKNLGKG